MHLQRVQVPDFRVLKDVDITFEKDFNPRVFPLGSQNGGGKSTLLQLIFVLLHCSGNSDRFLALKNLLNGFDLHKDKDRRVLAIIDIWDGEKTIQLEFFVCGDSYIQEILNNIDTDSDKFAKSFSAYRELNALQREISKFSQQERQLKEVLKDLKEKFITKSISLKFIDYAKTLLSNLEIEIEELKIVNTISIDSDFLNRIEENANAQLLARHSKVKFNAKLLSDNIDNLIELFKLSNIEYIPVYQSQENQIQDKALLCSVNNLIIDNARQFLYELSGKVFLAAPSTQVFLFISKDTRKLLFTDYEDEDEDDSYIYGDELRRLNSHLTGLFVYEFLSINLLLKSFASAKDKDFAMAVETNGEYGNNYKYLLNELSLLLNNKRIIPKADLSSIVFKTNITDEELYPEDLSHGELKRLSLYIWLKYRNIENSIVLMDEVDLALHPDWQYRITTDLVEWSPSNQYILATHSYEVCEALTPSHVKTLKPKLTERRSN